MCPSWRHPTTQISRKQKSTCDLFHTNKQPESTCDLFLPVHKQINKKHPKTAKKLNNPNFHHTRLRPGFQCIHFLWTWTSQCSKPHWHIGKWMDLVVGTEFTQSGSSWKETFPPKSVGKGDLCKSFLPPPPPEV